MKKLLVSMFLVCLLATVLPAAVILSGSTTDTIQFYAVQSSDHITPYTAGSSFTVYYSIDGGTATAMTTPTVTALDTTYMPGWYKLLVDEALMTVVPSGHDATNLALHITHASMDPVAREVEVREPLSTIAEVQSGLALETKQDTIIGKTNNLPASPAATGDIPAASAVADAVWDEALSGHATAGSAGAALSAAQSAGDPWSTVLPGSYGSGTAGYIVGNSAVAADLVDDIWDEHLSGHATAGSAGAALSAAQSAGDPWATALPGAYGAGTAGKALSDVLTDTSAMDSSSELRTLLTGSDTAVATAANQTSIINTLGVAGAGLSAIPWNAAWDAEAQSEATDALNAYDPPTNAEMEARTLVAANYFDPSADGVTLANGPQGGNAAVLTLKQVAVTNSDAGGSAVVFTGSGTGNSHALQLTSTNGKALAAGSVNNNAISVDSTNASGMVVVGATGDIVSDITGQVSGTADLLPDGFADNTMTDGKLDVNATVGDVTIEGNVNLTPEAIDAIFNEVIKGAHEVYGTLGWYLNAILGGQ